MVDGDPRSGYRTIRGKKYDWYGREVEVEVDIPAVVESIENPVELKIGEVEEGMAGKVVPAHWQELPKGMPGYHALRRSGIDYEEELPVDMLDGQIAGLVDIEGIAEKTAARILDYYNIVRRV